MFSFFSMTMTGVIRKNTRRVMKVLIVKTSCLPFSMPFSMKVVRQRTTKQEIIRKERSPVFWMTPPPSLFKV
jgi:hypothetical protein